MARGSSSRDGRAARSELSSLSAVRGDKAAFRLAVKDIFKGLGKIAKDYIYVYEGEPYTPQRTSQKVNMSQAMKLPVNLQKQILERFAIDNDKRVTKDGRPIKAWELKAIEAPAIAKANAAAEKALKDALSDFDSAFDVDDIVGKSEPLTAYVKFGDNIFKYKYQITNETLTEYRDDRRPRSITSNSRRIIEGSLERA